MVAYLHKEDAQRKLHECIVMYDGTPCLVKVRLDDPINSVLLTSTHDVYVSDKPAIRGLVVDVSNDKKFSIVAPRLGYVNSGGHTYSIKRSPVRRNKAGLHIENLIITPVNGVYEGRPFGITTPQFAAMLMNKYPDFKKAIKKVEDEGCTSCAFSKTLFISRVGKYDIGLFHDGRLVGMYQPSSEAFRITTGLRDYSYILSILRKHKVPTC